MVLWLTRWTFTDVLRRARRLEAETAILTVVFLTHTALRVLHEDHGSYLTVSAGVAPRTQTLVAVQAILAASPILTDVGVTVVDVGGTIPSLVAIRALTPGRNSEIVTRNRTIKGGNTRGIITLIFRIQKLQKWIQTCNLYPDWHILLH